MRCQAILRLIIGLCIGVDLGAEHSIAQDTQAFATLRGHSGTISSVAFSPDGKALASASYDHSVGLWEVATGKKRASLFDQNRGLGLVLTVAYHPDGQLLASSGVEYEVILWHTTIGKQRA